MWESAKKVTLIAAILVWIIFAIGAIGLSQQYDYRGEVTYSFITMLSYWVVGFILGSLLYGISGILEGQGNLAILLSSLRTEKKSDDAAQKQLESTQQILAHLQVMNRESSSDSSQSNS